MFPRTTLFAAAPVLLAVAVAAGAEGPATPPTSPPATAVPATQVDPAPARATTTDLARAYIELERAFFAAPVERELCREVNIAFDDASKLFFTGDFARVVEIVKANTARLHEQVFGEDWKPTHVSVQSVPDNDVELIAMRRAKRLAECDAALESLTWPVTAEGIWRARRALADSAILPNSVESLVVHPDLLIDQLSDELVAVHGNRNPYTHYRGDLWRPFFIDDQPAPMRLFCPENREPPAAGWPLIIALHGAGGNEHMFFAAYGVGRIKHLAQQHGFVVACPQNSPFSGQGTIFDAIVDSIALDYPIDRSRIYLVGHSMGAAVALAWSKSRHDKVAASALIAGAGRLSPRDTLPPTLVIAPELDGLIAAKSIIDNAERAAAAGVKAEVREIKDYGHTLVVGHVLPEVIEWLLKHTREGDAPAQPSPRTAEQGATP